MLQLAICDGWYCFSFIDIGEYGSNNDSRILKNSKMGKIFDNKMNIPDSEVIPGDDLELPDFLVGYQILPLKNWLMRLFSGKTLIRETHKIFHYRLSRACQIIDKTFDIMFAHWRIFQRPVEAKPEKIEKITLAVVALHDYLLLTNNACYTPSGFIDTDKNSREIIPGLWRNLDDANTLSVVLLCVGTFSN